MDFAPYPFERLNELIKDICPKKDIFKLTIGEPQFETPKNIQDELSKNVNLLNKYPSSAGETYLKDSQISFFNRRFGIHLERDEIISTFGTREVLFNFPCFVFRFLLENKTHKTMAFPNPFYQIYEGSAIASGADIIYMNLESSNNFKPYLDEDSLKKVDLVILNSPNNPTGAILTKQELEYWVELALEYNFILINDECYSEIYESTAPASILEASKSVNNPSFKNILCVNSISKRSSAPGLRSGFIAGDKNILKKYMLYRTYIGCSIPLPLQKAATLAWNDEESPKMFRDKYATNLRIARDILNITISPYTFYIWLKIDDDLVFTKKLYEEEGILVLPGRYLGRNDAGKGYIRIALVYDEHTTQEVLKRLKLWI
ncbi:hypothetical protein CCY99_07805 [Helicobacter sp. 16-1353]|uniref:succinyldiaminopimelate transaminase n=1 Tax=Helicobacter sp. 16-1353 TaxID=2004996 RepID=UPI000DCED40C|nr:succinyldiaminopimelate transaminase [Helicobacter sp. 16-1353]RAX52046.1 hypothetical protein CCY99_07805 [Helicobacter sp. 16-1353]